MKSAAKALAILARLEPSCQGKSLAELSAELGLNKSTALRLLRTLVAERVLQRDEVTGLYAPDASSWLCLAPHLHPALSFLAAVQRTLDDLAAAAQATAVLALPCTGRRYAVAWMYGEPKVPVYFDARGVIGVHAIPLHAAAAGKCYLASLRPDVLASYLGEGLAATTKHTITSPAALKSELQRVRDQQYAVSDHEAFDALRTVAVPVGEPIGEVLGALSLLFVGSGVRASKEADALPLLRDAGKVISNMLSYTWWMENVANTRAPSVFSTLPWDTPDPGFGDGPTPYVRSVARMMRLMAALFAHPRGMSLGEIAAARGLDKATARRLLSTLIGYDVVWQSNPDRRYHIAPVFWLTRSSLMRSANSLTSASEAILQGLAAAAGATVTLELPDREGRHSVVYQYALPPGPIRFHPPHRPSSPLHTTAAGKCYLAARSKWALGKYLKQVLARVPGRAGASRDDLLRELDRVRQLGYAQSQQELSPTANTMAVPLTEATGETVGAVAITSADEITPALTRQWLPLLQHAANMLSRLLVADWRELR